MKIVGYCDRYSVAPGETIRFMVSSRVPRYRAELVQLIHGDLSPDGPGLKERPVATDVDGEYAGREQRLPHGSYVRVADSELLPSASFSLVAWIWPTTPQKGAQGLLTRWSAAERRGYGLVIDESGALALWLGDGAGPMQRVTTDVPLRAKQWYFVAAAYDAKSGQVRLVQQLHPRWPVDTASAVVERRVRAAACAGVRGDFLMAAWEGVGDTLTGGHFNGKLESPGLFRTALSAGELEWLRRSERPGEVSAALVASWDFALDIPTARVRDVGRHGLHGAVLQMPARAMTGHAWAGDLLDWTEYAGDHNAIHFHDDDLVDAGWEADFELTVPDSLRSGVYAAKLNGDGAVDWIPFFVRPKDRKASAKILWLAPTNSYLAYANSHAADNPELKASLGLAYQYPVLEQDKYMIENRLLSCYDHHSDDSGVCYSSRLRPVVSMRPTWVEQILGIGTGYPHQFNADLHLVDWLVEQGFEFDVATDEDLQFEGLGLLSQYRVVLSGSHHEYWTEQGLDSLEAYLQDGGRFMYLAGNGLYWVTSFHPERPWVVEIRRWGGTQAWTAQPGEYHHSTTGELGGLWRERGRAPNRYVGTGFTAQGIDRSLPYRRAPGSFDPRVSWIFKGIGDDEVIGDFGLVMEGVAGFELDRVDYTLGSPPHTLILATSSGYSDSYQAVIEEVAIADSLQGGTVNQKVRGEMAYFETPGGGAVFSASSISYCGSLSHNHYDNNVSRITRNVLTRFLDERPLP